MYQPSDGSHAQAKPFLKYILPHANHSVPSTLYQCNNPPSMPSVPISYTLGHCNYQTLWRFRYSNGSAVCVSVSQ